MNNIILFVVFPYVAVVLAIWGGVHRYRTNRFSYSTLSSQLLENRMLFWGSVPWHDGLTVGPLFDRNRRLRIRAGRAVWTLRSICAPPFQRTRPLGDEPGRLGA